MPSNDIIDLRSDTLTKPTDPMRQAMAQAEVGDDVFEEDPSILALQNRVAEMLGKEAAVYVPSGSMSNTIGLRLHGGPGDEFICEAGCHIFNMEQSAYAQLNGLAARPVEAEEHILQVDLIRDLIRGNNEHVVRTKFVTLENTHNRGSGRVMPYDALVEICDWAHSAGLTTHLDGARLFNAVVATGIDAKTWAQHFDTVSVCFSKGLGAPVGSAIVGSSEWMRLARRHRKVLGGGMRQAGVIAAGALYALENHVDRLADDHRNTQALSDAVRASDALELVPRQIDTNIVIFRVDPKLATASAMVAALAQKGVLMLALSGETVRAVTHLDVDQNQTKRAAEMIRDVAGDIARGDCQQTAEGIVYH